MKPSPRIVRWESTADATRCGVEIAGLELGKKLESELDRILGGLAGIEPAFVVAGFDSGSPTDVAKAFNQSGGFFSSSHVCLALDQAMLLAVDQTTLRTRNFGVLLDHVNANTPLSALCAQTVEAIRFTASFVHDASKDARLSCVMDSMLKLAHDLGVATLASGPHLDLPRDNEFAFDYLPTSSLSDSASAHSAD